MAEVRYSVNGKYFKDYNVLISKSDGIGDELKRKKVNTYDWAEYHGQSVDLSNPKYEAREITLKGFVIGSHWDEMMENFNTILYEFQKPGTQRLLIEPFNMKPRPYEVYMEDSSELQKTFREGKMAGVFSLKLIEPNPIKKVLYLTGSSLNLAYNSPKETEIFYGNGMKETASGNVSLSGKTLANRVVSGYGYVGRNMLANSESVKLPAYAGSTVVYTENFAVPEWGATTAVRHQISGGTNITNTFYVLGTPANGEVVTLSFYAKNLGANTVRFYSTLGGKLTDLLPGEQKLIKWEGVAGNGTTSIRIQARSLDVAHSLDFAIWRVMYEKGAVATPYSAAPEEQKFIIIAGNVDEITNLQTNAAVLWEKL